MTGLYKQCGTVTNVEGVVEEESEHQQQREVQRSAYTHCSVCRGDGAPVNVGGVETVQPVPVTTVCPPIVHYLKPD